MTHKNNKTFVHIVTYNHASYIEKCIQGVLKQEGFTLGEDLFIHITDNNSSDETLSKVKPFEVPAVSIQENKHNLGFSVSHNQGIQKFSETDCSFYLCLNPDLSLESKALKTLVESLSANSEAGTACPKLIRADSDLKPLYPSIIDAAGMVLTSSLRHFDRGGETIDKGQYDQNSYVFGGSGACLLMKREFIEDVSITQPEFDETLKEIYPQYKYAEPRTLQVFDEGFFAYREDADLAWRAQSLGWKCLYVATALGFHVRRVTPEKRASLPSEINLLGVQNRFLLQLNNYSISYGLKSFLSGYVFRNFIVYLAVLFKERKSIQGIKNFIKLIPRGTNRRTILSKKKKVADSKVARWLSIESESINEL